MILELQRDGSGGQQTGQFAHFLMVARPLDRLARLLQFDRVRRVRTKKAARLRGLQRPFGSFPTVDAGGAEEDHGVLDFLLLEAAAWIEVFGKEADDPGVVAFEKIAVEVRQRLLRHSSINVPPVL